MYPLTIEHLLWRMRHVHKDSHVLDISGIGNRRTYRSFPDIAARAEHLSAGLHAALGIGEGDVVGVLAFNTSTHLEAMFAIPRLGAAVNSLNGRLTAEALSEQALSPRPMAVLVDTEVIDHPALGDSAARLLSRFRAERIPVIGIGDRDWSQITDTCARYEQLIDRGARLDAPPAIADELLTAYLFHTSGTTGPPKMYPVSHRAVVLHALAQSGADAAGLSHHDTVLPLAPFFHVNGWGLPFTCALTGASMVLAGGDLAAGRVAGILAEEGVTAAAAVPTVWHDLCAAVRAHRAPAPSALHTAFTGGSAVSRTIADSVVTVLGARLVNAWGMTETMACSTYERDQPCASAGRPIPLVEISLDTAGFAEDGNGPGMGRLQVRGPFVVGPGAAEGDWFETGDIASIDDDGNVALHDRDKDLIKSGGEWIATAELELHLCDHPVVTGAAVVAVPDERWTERPVAFVTVTPGYGGEELDVTLRNHVRSRYPRWWTPDRFTVLEELPTTSVGKVDKARCRELAQWENQIPKEEIA